MSAFQQFITLVVRCINYALLFVWRQCGGEKVAEFIGTHSPRYVLHRAVWLLRIERVRVHCGILASIGALSTVAFAADQWMACPPSPAPDVSYYELWYGGGGPRAYTNRVISPEPLFLVQGLEPGRLYWCATIAVATGGFGSDFSVEFSARVPERPGQPLPVR